MDEIAGKNPYRRLQASPTTADKCVAQDQNHIRARADHHKKGHRDDHYDLFLGNDKVAGFELKPNTTPVWIDKGHQKSISVSTVEKIAEDFVDQGGAGMRMC